MPTNAGLPILALGALLWTWQLRRLARANATSRLPWFDWPTTVPRGARQLTGLGLGAVGFGVALLAGDTRGAATGLVCALPAVVIAALIGMIAVHNTRVPRRFR